MVNYFQDDILSMEILPPDSAKLLIGEYGNNGIIVIRTLGLNPNIFYKEEHRLFSDKPKIILDDKYREDLDINMIIDPRKFDISSIKIISPFNAVAKYGFEMKGGVWEVYTKEN